MYERLLIAGSGGQGIILAGRLLATSAMSTVPHVTFFPSYGAEVRGGTSSCQVILSDREIASPLSEAFDGMMIMSQASLDRFLPRNGAGCLTVVNASLCRTPDLSSAVLVNATEMAKAIGDARVANMVMLGAYLAHKAVCQAADVEAALIKILADKNRDLVILNIRAFRTGLRL